MEGLEVFASLIHVIVCRLVVLSRSQVGRAVVVSYTHNHPLSLNSLITEAFVVCQGYNPPEGYEPTMENILFRTDYGTRLFTLCTVRGVL